MPLEPPNPALVRTLVRRALAEDVGPGDITATAVVPRAARAVAQLVARTDGVLAGAEVAALAFSLVEPQVAVEYHRRDGARLAPPGRVDRRGYEHRHGPRQRGRDSGGSR